MWKRPTTKCSRWATSARQARWPAARRRSPLTLKKVGNNILDAIVGTMSPLIPAIIGGSMVKLLVMLLGMVGVLSADSETYKILNTIGDAAFYFLPVMVAASASKKFNTNMFIAIAIAGLCCTRISAP